MRNIMKLRYIICTLCMLIAALSLSGCHGGDARRDFEMPESFDESREYEVVFWAKNDTNKTQTEIYQRCVDEFESLYPNIHVNLKLYTDYSTIYNDVITNVSTDTTPNVCITYPDHIATYMTGAGEIVFLDDVIDDPRYGLGGSELRFDGPRSDEIVPKYLDELRLKGHLMGLPFMRSSEALYINKTYVEAMGYEIPDVPTWDWVWEVSEAALAKNEDGTYAVNGQDVMIPFIYKSTDNMLITMLRQMDAGYSDDNGNILIFNDVTGSILKEISLHGQSRSFSTFKISSYPGNFMNAGQCILAVDSTAGATWMGSDAPLSDIHESKIVEFETVVRPVPQYDAGNVQMISQGPSVCIFNKDDPQEVLASWLFAQFLLTNDVQESYSETEGYVPVTVKAINDPAYQEYLSLGGSDNGLHYQVKIDCVNMIIENTDNTFITPVFNGSASLRNAAGQMVENCVKSVRRGGTVDDAFLESMYSDVSQMYRLGEQKVSAGSKDLGPLPTTAVVLLVCIGLAWLGMGIYVVKTYQMRYNSMRSERP
ncbi:MAG: extracellular solute-binding protein [Lachnospiraceae bacterium]|nr:extracellular solute-binding protein [Lachnospiraceae bacterium]